MEARTCAVVEAPVRISSYHSIEVAFREVLFGRILISDLNICGCAAPVGRIAEFCNLNSPQRIADGGDGSRQMKPEQRSHIAQERKSPTVIRFAVEL
jgi:hypothetical protein